MQGVFLELLILLHHEYLIIIADSSLDVKSLLNIFCQFKRKLVTGGNFQKQTFSQSLQSSFCCCSVMMSDDHTPILTNINFLVTILIRC